MGTARAKVLRQEQGWLPKSGERAGMEGTNGRQAWRCGQVLRET